MYKLDLSLLFRKYAEKYAKEIKNNIKRRKSLDGSGYSPLKNRRPKGHEQGINTRLNDTGEFARNAVVFSSDDTSLTVEGNQAMHPTGISYNDIIAYNNMDSGDTNRNVLIPPKIFPTQESDVSSMKSTEEFSRDLQRAIEIQLGDVAKNLKLPTIINIG